LRLIDATIENLLLFYGSWCKTVSLVNFGNGVGQSGWQWAVSAVEFRHEIPFLVISSMDKFINLFYSLAVSHRTPVESPLTGRALENIVVGCMQYVEFSLEGIPNQGAYEMQGPNLDIGICGTIGLPKALKGYGNGSVLLEAKPVNPGNTSRNFSTIGDGGNTAPIHPQKGINTGNMADSSKDASLKLSKDSPLITVKDLNNPFASEKVVFAPIDPAKLIHVICHVDVLMLAYYLIKSNPGNMTPGSTPETLDGMDVRWIHKTCQALRAGKFQFGLARRIMIPKDGKPGKRPLTMASPREKVVQKAMAMVLNSLFEPIFLDYSHGFRPHRGCHSALQMVDRTFRGGKWVIEADLTKCFDRIPHSKLLEVVGRTVSCQKTLALIKSGLKAGYIKLGEIVSNETIGTPQGSILSPLLSNIYLHELDKFMQVLIAEYTQGKTRRKNPAFRSIQYQMDKIKGTTGDTKALRDLRRKLWSVQSKDQMYPNFRRLSYVRYADDFVICVTGPRKLALDIMGKVDSFLTDQLGLEMNREKTILTKLSEGINFLGLEITNRKVSIKPIKLTPEYKVRVTPRLSFHAPIRKILERIVVRGYMRRSQTQNRMVPTALRSVVNLGHRDILMLYNAVIRGILNYYSCADNRKSLGSIIHGLKLSCALTLALKFKLRTAAKAFKAYGPELTFTDRDNPKRSVKLYIPHNFARLDHKEKFNTKDSKLMPPQKVINLSGVGIAHPRNIY
jgi:group II intron reverse transcriptase/maturase